MPSLPLFDPTEMIQIPPGACFWATPKSRDFGALADPAVYAETLEIAKKEGVVSAAKLRSSVQGLRQRLRRLSLVENPSITSVTGVLKNLTEFGWLIASDPGGPQFRLTKIGEEVASQLMIAPDGFRRRLVIALHDRYVIPGWMISRLHLLNPSGQGEVVLPSPSKQWQPSSRRWEDSGWTADLEEQARAAVDIANSVFPGSFPIELDKWLAYTRSEWVEIGRRQSKMQEKRNPTQFAPRERLTQAMREASIALLFSNTQPGSRICDFVEDVKAPLSRRSFQAWCPRLDDFELMFYTDSHPNISGRLLFPCSTYRRNGRSLEYEPLTGIEDPKGRTLHLHRPNWDQVEDRFLRVLMDSYGRISKSAGSLYVSLLDVRDEVCRRLRLSSLLFDNMLTRAYRETISVQALPEFPLTISLESDVRPEQRTGHGLLRRPVYIDGIAHSLIALASRRTQ